MEGYNFFSQQGEDEQMYYMQLLTKVGELSKLFSDSSIPYLYYRAHENIFCLAFGAENQSRGDISIDASHGEIDGISPRIGLGLKTFLHKNGNTSQKIAEFNSDRPLFEGKTDRRIIEIVSELRNIRLESTENITSTNISAYHLITRSEGLMRIHETPMEIVNLNKISGVSRNRNVIYFNDGVNHYSFNTSKSTLYKKFDLRSKETFVREFPVTIMEDPYSFLTGEGKPSHDELYMESPFADDYLDLNSIMGISDIVDEIVLPLYSVRSGLVEERSGLNMWNSSGRPRDMDEVYIPVPKKIHQIKPEFFPNDGVYKPELEKYKTDSFEVRLPNGKNLSMKVTQDGGKALQSDPNKALGKWILREVLELQEGKLVTIQMLEERGIDSVRISKHSSGMYSMNFAEIGSYEDFISGAEKD
ncbi:restriction endonuclease PLD domain-containing protein [Rothia nasimurium]|uniref:restriction endonuclease PLD domain-containing protein n=1 Tax=Rothia nasimurium TaxID=85336 RepID=UPI001F175DFA|nr:restriction endonuclease PLD domain-containing protein [Rothia nasimurium]